MSAPPFVVQIASAYPKSRCVADAEIQYKEMAPVSKNPLDTLYRRPGFMIRRVHQMAVSVFLEETGSLGVTNRQYGILFVLKHRPNVDQISIATLLGLDRSTTGMVVKKLEGDGLVVRSLGDRDRRRHSLRLTPAGEKLLSRLADPARKAEARVLSAFTPREQALFLDLLEKFTRKFNETTRVRLDPHRSRASVKPRPRVKKVFMD